MTGGRWRWTWWSLAWAVWLAAFAVIEGAALVNPAPGDTLSEHVWHLVNRSSFWGFTVAGLLVWLFWHFLYERDGHP